MLPAVGGIFFHNGSAVVTDMMLLLLVAVFLHWLVKFPWEWYNSSQVLVCEDEADEIGRAEAGGGAEAGDGDGGGDGGGDDGAVRRAARQEMSRHETTALACCFLGPLLGGWILHAVRAQLSRPSEGLVSDFNLTVFVLAAELRPMAQVIKLVRQRTIHLQRLAARAPVGRVQLVESKVEALEAEVRDLARLTRRMAGREGDLDALNRGFARGGATEESGGGRERDRANRQTGAVRRYERKEALQSAQTETRILEINHRLALTAASARAAQQQRYRCDTLSAALLDYACGVMTVPFSIAWKLVSLPLRAGRMAMLRESLGGEAPRRRAVAASSGRIAG